MFSFSKYVDDFLFFSSENVYKERNIQMMWSQPPSMTSLIIESNS